MKWAIEEDVIKAMKKVIQDEPGILASKLTKKLNEGETNQALIITQGMVSRLINYLVDSGEIRTVFIKGQVWRACYSSDYPIAVTIGEKNQGMFTIRTGPVLEGEE